jgi:hypothetical protein
LFYFAYRKVTVFDLARDNSITGAYAL